MASRMYTLCILGAALFVSSLSSAASEIIDSDTSNGGVESIASALCKESVMHNRRIGRLSTIIQLADHFESLPPTSELAGCRSRYLVPLSELKVILEASTGNVCTLETAELINKFHLEHIASSLSVKWRMTSGGDGGLPEPLRIFFMNFANEVTERCKATMASRLESTVAGNQVQMESPFFEKFANLMDQFGVALVTRSFINNYDSFMFIWNKILSRARKSGNSLVERVDPTTGEPIFALIKLQDPTNAWLLQQKCRTELRPIYGHTVLPAMKLIDLGYGKVEAATSAAVKGSNLIPDWYAIAQFCELILPVNFYLDESLKAGEVALLDTFEEAAGLRRSLEETAGAKVKVVSLANVEPVQMGDFLQVANGDGIVKQVQSNTKARGKMYRHLVRKAVAGIKSQLGSKLKQIFLLTKSDDDGDGDKSSYVRESGDAIVEEAAVELKSEEEEESAAAGGAALSRRKRGLGKVIRKVWHGLKKTGIAVAMIIFLIYYLILSFIYGCWVWLRREILHIE